MKYRLQDLIDIERFQELQDRLNKIYAFPSSIIDNDGNILTATAWQEICTKFHRENREAEKICIKSDQYINAHIHEANPALSYHCPHGLVDNATPIIIEGIHYGNFFTGQFFLEAPDLAFFRNQAKKYGFDEAAYLKAVKKVPIWNQEQLDSYLLFIRELIHVISESGLKKLKEMEHRKQIQKSEEQYRSILKAAMDGFWRTDITGRILEVNDAYCVMSGYSEAELLTMHISDMEVVETVALVARHMEKVIQSGADRFESRHRRKDGSIIDVEVSIQYRPDEGGQCICFVRDITERKQAIEKLRAANEKMRMAADSAHFGIWDLDIAENRLEWDEWMFRLYGVERDAFSSAFESWQAAVHPEDLARSTREVEQALRGEKAFDSEFRIVRPDGTVRHIKAYGSVSRDNRGEPVHMTGINYDITERKAAEQALRESEARFKALHNASFGGIAIHEKGIILECNKGLSEITGFDYDELMGMNGLYLISDDTRDTVIRNIETGYEKPYEVTGIRKNGELYPLRLEARVIPFRGKSVRVVEFRDITENKRIEAERKDLEEKLRQVYKMESIGNLAGGIAHDFNNILFPIVGMAELLLEDLPEGSTEHENAGEILKAGKRGSDLVKQILAFSRQSEHKMIPTLIQAVLKEVLKLSKSTIPSSIEIENEIQPDCDLIMADPTQIHQVVMNLITNAYHAVEENGGKITVRLSETALAAPDLTGSRLHPGKYAMLSISDTGHGIAPNHLDKIFDPYFTTKEQGKGTGLGLAVVHGIVKEHKGDIKVESAAGKGSTFHVYLPLMEQSARQAASRPGQIYRSGTEHILLVDDEESVAKLLKQILERLGYRVTDRTSSPEALETFRSNPSHFDLVISDLTMPTMTGEKLAVALKTIRPDIPVIICTGFSERFNESKAEALGISAYLMKPIIKSELAATIRKVLENPRR